jgi:hypothetical protein
MTHYRDQHDARLDELCKPVPLAEVLGRIGNQRSQRTIDRWIKAGRLRVIDLGAPPGKVVILRELLELEHEMTAAVAASKANIAARGRARRKTPQEPTEPAS